MAGWLNQLSKNHLQNFGDENQESKWIWTTNWTHFHHCKLEDTHWTLTGCNDMQKVLGPCWNVTLSYGVCCFVKLPRGYGHLNICTYLTNILYILDTKRVCSCTKYCFLYIIKLVRNISKRDYYVLHICPHGTTRFPLDGFSCNLIFENFSKICLENSSVIKIRQE